jgi:hypothetical protein
MATAVAFGARMFPYFTFRRDQFLGHCRKQSNAETTVQHA